jgi:hypothetical protein
MIRVAKQPEPADFDKCVRKPGARFLAMCPKPKNKEWQEHRYWNKSSKDLYRAYNGICAYTGEWFSLTTSMVSVDHFRPKSHYPCLAYEWDNYRLTTQKANMNKDNNLIIDPFDVKPGWFVLVIPTCLIVSGKNIGSSIRKKVDFTIEKLKLNSDDEYVQRRCDIINDYMNGDMSFAFLGRKYPFIACELARQNLDSIEKLGIYFKSYKKG